MSESRFVPMHRLALVATRPDAGPEPLDKVVAKTAIARSVAQNGRHRWLKDNIAFEIQFSTSLAAARQALEESRAQLAAYNIDINVVSDDLWRRKRLFLADMDSTIIGQECIDELAEVAGVGGAVSTITERAMRGEIDFEGALRERVGLLKGLPASTIETVFDERISLTAGAATLVATMKSHGAYTALVSGGFTAFTAKVAAAAGFEENRANSLVIENNTLTGDVADPILGREAKLAALQDLTARHGFAMQASMAVGDGANDLAMLSAAGLGVAFRAKPIVAAQADAVIQHCDLTALLYLQGYTFDEFIVTDNPSTES